MIVVNSTKKRNILIVHNYYQISGGEDTVVANEKKMLEKHGHKVILYSRHNIELNKMSRLQKLLLPITTLFNPRTYREIKKLIKSEHIEIVHVHNTLNLISPAVYYAASDMKVPVIQTVHNFRLLCPGATFYRDGHICEECVQHGLKCAIRYSCYRNSKIQTLACVLSICFHRMTGIYGKINYICLTEFNKSKLLELKQISPEAVFVKPNFVENNDIIISIQNRENRYIYVGRLDKLKGIEILFEAWKLMKKTAPKLLVCGTGPMENWCNMFLKDNPDCNIQMMGVVPNVEVKGLIANSKALILPTQWYEGLPMTILEAYSVGTAVIGSDIGNVGDLIEDGVSGMKFRHNSPESLRETVISFGEKAIQVPEFVVRKYCTEENYSRLNQIYETIIDR